MSNKLILSFLFLLYYNNNNEKKSYEYGFGQSPGEESHGGSTFCGTAALTLMGKQKEGLLNKDRLIKWCLDRQSTGFQGRPNKQPDTCYCFWIGASLDVSEVYNYNNNKKKKEKENAADDQINNIEKTQFF